MTGELCFSDLAPWPEAAFDPEAPWSEDQLEHYLKCLGNGCSVRLAEMLALQSPPMSNTDREFMEGRCNGNQFEKHPLLGDFYKQEAARAGVNTTGKTYLSGLASYPGDPRAWVSGRGDAQKVCEERGWGCDGSVKVKATRFAESGGRYQVAEDIVQERVEEMLSSAPEPQKVDREEVRDQAVKTLSPNWK